ncbi:hypothetical protein S245_071116, partial [Arachis hypogaea]
ETFVNNMALQLKKHLAIKIEYQSKESYTTKNKPKENYRKKQKWNNQKKNSKKQVVCW